ncbi:MAG: SRPBCC family protein [Flavobacteriales bacterium]
MNRSLVIRKSIEINASKEAIWDALINPSKIAKYLYGTKITTSWEEGSSISFKGEYEGHQYSDKGVVVEVIPNQKLVYDYWSQFSQLPDTRDNYSQVHCEISEQNGKCKLDMTQTGFGDEVGMGHSDKSWDGVMQGIKDVAENGNA